MVDIADITNESNELQKQYDLLTEEIQFLKNSERIDNLSPRDQFKLKKQIEEVEAEREIVKQQLKELEKGGSITASGDFFSVLRRLGYRKQIRLFRRAVEKKDSVAFLIHGYPDYGQSWLLNRLVSQYVEHFLTGKIIRVDVGRKVRRNDVSALWREVARQVGLKGKQYSPAEIAQQISQCIKTQDVLIVFHEVETLPKSTLNELIQDFWLPLSAEVQASSSVQNRCKLLMFLIDYEGYVGEWDIPLIDKLDTDDEATVPLKPPIIREFSDGELINWVEDEYDMLPDTLTQQADDNIAAILKDTENGIPELVLDVICSYCGYDWYEESKKWLTL